MDFIEFQHMKYPSLENYRNKFLPNYLDIYSNGIIVQEKIHGSNICIVGKFINGKWLIKYGSRNRWINQNENFHNIQSVYENYKENIINLFNELKSLYNQEIIIRLFGEIFGGKYGTEKNNKSIRVQKVPNYCPFNDICFFDIIINEKKIDILKTIGFLKQYNLKIPPIIYQGEFKDFINNFEINSFNSKISTELYNLPFINTPKATEGIIIRTINPEPKYKEEIILKYKKDWASESGKKNTNIKTTNKDTKLEIKVYNMINENRFNNYISKNTIYDILNIKLLNTHVNEITNDIIIDIQKEFSANEIQELNIKNYKKKISKKIFKLFKNHIKELDNDIPKTIQERLNILNNSYLNILIDINSIKNRIKIINTRI